MKKTTFDFDSKRLVVKAAWAFLVVVVCAAASDIFSQTAFRRNGKIAFTSDREGNREIYVMDPDGSNQTRLTNNIVFDDHPKWSPHGRKIAFVSRRASGGLAIFVMNADGSARTEVTPVSYLDSHFSMSWSPDGTQIVFSENISNAGALSIVNADGSNRRNLTAGIHPAWSPDGSTILFLHDTGDLGYELFTIRPDGTEIRNILIELPDLLSIAGFPVWSPDGSKFAFNATDFIATSAILIANSDGSNPQFFGNEYDASPRWSPNGRSIAFIRPDDYPEVEIFVSDAAGGEQTQITSTTGSNFNPDWQPLPNTPFDYDGDGRTDISVYRPSNGTWYVARSLLSDMYVRTFPSLGILPADYDGDGKTDLATCDYWNPSDNSVPLVILNSSTNTTSSQQCLSGDLALAADFDGDGKSDHGAWELGYWQITLSESYSQYGQWWGSSEDKLVPADFDGDGRAELAVWRPSEGKWYVANLATGGITVISWGVDGDIPVPGDYNSDGRADFALYRPSNNTWYRLHSNDYSIQTTKWGQAGDIVTPGDYDGDGRIDAAVFRPSNGTWYIVQSSAGIRLVQFGQDGDVPTPAAFIN